MKVGCVLAVDQGTSGTTCLIVDLAGTVLSRAYAPVRVTHPRDGWAEQDAEELWRSVLAAAAAALRQAGDPAPLALGIANQRETVVVFDRRSLGAVAPAIVWQCRRSAALCAEHRRRGEEVRVRAATGLLLDPYFSATKIEWLLRERPELRPRAERGELCAGTVDTWLVARLTAGRTLATDASNASRTLLHALGEPGMNGDLCELFGVPQGLLAPVTGSAGRVASTDPDAFLGLRLPISGMAGDQQAALFGHACFTPGMSKSTYGTGSFVLVNAGTTAPSPSAGIVATVAWRLGGVDTFALEGSIFVTGAALSWLRDSVHLLTDLDEVAELIESVPDSAGCIFVPALAGLGAPHWDPAARGAFLGLTAGTGRAHLVRAVVEAMAMRTRDVVEAMEADGAVVLDELRVDGGASVLDTLCQVQADQLGIPVVRSVTAETTAFGAAMLAAVGEDLLDLNAVAAAWRPGRRFEPAQPGRRPDHPYARWRAAVASVRNAAVD